MKGVVRVLVGECTSYYSNFLIICILYIVEKQKPFRIFGKISKVQMSMAKRQKQIKRRKAQ